LNTQIQFEASDRPRILRFLGYGLAIVSLVCLVWVLHDFHLVRALHDIANVDWKWVLVGMAFDVLSYGVQAVRWKVLLVPFGRVRLGRSIRAVFAGLFANVILPLRPGEFLRSYLLSTSEGITLGRVIGSVGVERLVDLVIATASLAIASLFVGLPQRFRRVADTLGIVTLVLLSILVVLILILELHIGDKPEPEEPRPGFRGKLIEALRALHAMGTAPSFYSAVMASLLMPLCQALALWALMRSYDMRLPFLAAVVVLLVINLGVSLPNAPANLGSYQLFCVLGLSVFDVDKTTATGFSFFAFLALTLPLIFLGFVALLRSGLSLHTMREKVGRLPSHPHKQAVQT
jgi:glycosyltransferase 2 family protein